MTLKIGTRRQRTKHLGQCNVLVGLNDLWFEKDHFEIIQSLTQFSLYRFAQWFGEIDSLNPCRKVWHAWHRRNVLITLGNIDKLHGFRVGHFVSLFVCNELIKLVNISGQTCSWSLESLWLNFLTGWQPRCFWTNPLLERWFANPLAMPLRLTFRMQFFSTHSSSQDTFLNNHKIRLRNIFLIQINNL